MVFSLAPNWLAICLFSSPLTTREKTSRSRGVSEAYRSWSTVISACCSLELRLSATARWTASSRSLILARFSNKLHRASFHCPHRGGHVALTGDKNDRKIHVRISQFPLQIEAAQIG